jgi:hypothetical protein
MMMPMKKCNDTGFDEKFLDFFVPFLFDVYMIGLNEVN